MWTKLLLLSLTSSCISIFVLKKYFGGKYCKCKNKLNGKVIIVTGANSGIGKETATILASKGAEVILACRSIEKSQEAANDIVQKTGSPLVHCEILDLSRFESIIDFVNRFREKGTKLYGLVNNAGLFYFPHRLTEDGFDETLQTNYLGPFLLTCLLLDILKKSAPSRIVNIGSQSHKFPKSLEISNITKHFTKQEEFDKFMFYGSSKLCLLLFTTKLAKLLKGTGVTVNCADPGNVRSNIHRYFPDIRDLPFLSLSRFLLWFTFKTPHQGAQTVVHLLSDPSLDDVSGKYFSENAESDVSNLAKSLKLEEELWESTLHWLQPYIAEDVFS